MNGSPHSFGSEPVSVVSPSEHSLVPVVTIENDLFCRKLASKATPDQGLIVTFKAQYGEVSLVVVCRVIIYVVHLHGTSCDSALTACSICSEENRGHHRRRHRNPNFTTTHSSAPNRLRGERDVDWVGCRAWIMLNRAHNATALIKRNDRPVKATYFSKPSP